MSLPLAQELVVNILPPVRPPGGREIWQGKALLPPEAPPIILAPPLTRSPPLRLRPSQFRPSSRSQEPSSPAHPTPDWLLGGGDPPLITNPAPDDRPRLSHRPSPPLVPRSREARARAVAAGPARGGDVRQARGPRQQQQVARRPAPGGAGREAALRAQPVVALAAAGGGRRQGRAPAAPEAQLLLQAVRRRGPGSPAGTWGSGHPGRGIRAGRRGRRESR